jgi:hypothetical protein
MNKLVAELREFGSVEFSDDSHAVWDLPKFEFKFDVNFEDIGINSIGCRLETFKFQGKSIDMKGQYIIKQDTSDLLKIALNALYDRRYIITPEDFCESFIEFRLNDNYTELLKHERYMKFLQTPIGVQMINARNWHDEMCAHGYTPEYDGKIMSTSGKLNGNEFKFEFELNDMKSEATITYYDKIYKFMYGTGTMSALDVVKKFIDMVNS